MEDSSKNKMSYGCYSEFVPEQINLMHFNIENNPQIMLAEGCPSSSSSFNNCLDYTVQGQEIWTNVTRKLCLNQKLLYHPMQA